MKRGLSVEWVKDYHLLLKKERGKLSLSEIEDVLRYEHDRSRQPLYGNYAIILRCGESTVGGNGMYSLGMEEAKGDEVTLVLLDDFSECPVCNEMLPPIQYCPHCLKDLFQKPEIN